MDFRFRRELPIELVEVVRRWQKSRQNGDRFLSAFVGRSSTGYCLKRRPDRPYQPVVPSRSHCWIIRSKKPTSPIHEDLWPSATIGMWQASLSP